MTCMASLPNHAGGQLGHDAAAAVWGLPAEQTKGAWILPLDRQAVLL